MNWYQGLPGVFEHGGAAEVQPGQLLGGEQLPGGEPDQPQPPPSPQHPLCSHVWVLTGFLYFLPSLRMYHRCQNIRLEVSNIFSWCPLAAGAFGILEDLHLSKTSKPESIR